VRNDEATRELLAALRKLSNWTQKNFTKWDDPNTKTWLLNLIDLLPPQIDQVKKNELKAKVNRKFSIMNGFTNPMIMIDDINKLTKHKYNESFDQVLGHLLRNTSFNEDEFKLDLLEVVGRRK